APTAPVLTAPAGWVNSSWVTLTHEASTDPDLDVLTYRYTVRDETTGQVVAAQTINPLVTGLAHGHVYSWSVTVADGYTTVTSATAQFAVDVMAPEIALDNLSDTYAQSQAITVTAQDPTSGLASLEYRWNAEAYQALPSGQVLSAPHGKNTLSVRATDAAGNVREIQHTYFVDETPPEVGAPVVTGTRHADGRLFVTSNSEIFAAWRMADPETGIASYRYGVVKQAEQGNLSGLLAGGAGNTGGTGSSSSGGTAGAGNNYRQLVSQPLLDGEVYLFAVEATNGVGRVTGPVYSEPIQVDASPPVIAQIAINGAQAAGGSLYTSDFSLLTPAVTAEDPHSGVALVEYALVEQPNLAALAGTGAAKWVTDPRTMDTTALTNGQTYYYAARVTNGVGLAAIAFSGGVTLDQTPPVILRLEDEGVAKRENTSLSATVQANDDESGIAACRYAVGTSPGGQEITKNIAGNQAGWLTAQSSGPQVDLKLDGLQLPDGIYYFTVQVENGAGLVATAVTDGMAIDSTLRPAPKVADDGVYTANTHELHATGTFADAERPVEYYLYQIEDRQGTVVQSWRQANLVSLPGGGANANATAEILARGADPAAGLGLVNGQTYYFKVKAIYLDNTESEVGPSNGITVDTTKPTSLSIEDGRFAPANNLRVSWQAKDPESGISGYRYGVGTSRGNSDMSGGFIPAGTATSVAITNLPLQDGQTYYVTVIATNGAGLEEYLSSDGVTIDSTPPPAPKVLDSGDFLSPVNQSVLTASWTWTPSDPQSGTVGYAYALTMERQVTAATNWTPVGTQTKVSLPVAGLNLVEGATYYFAVKAVNGAGTESVGFSDGMVIDSSVPGLVVDDHGDYSILPDRLNATLTGTDLQSGVQSYRYRVGTEATPALVAGDTTLAAKGGAQDVEELVVASPTRLTDGGIYFFDVSLTNHAGLSNGARSDGVMVDTLAPLITGVTDDGLYTRNNQELFASWRAQSTPSGIVEYEYALTTNPNETLPVWQSAGPAAGLPSGSVLVKNLSLTDGMTYYFLVRARNAAGTYTPAAQIGKSDGITVDTSPPAAPVVQDDGAYTTSRLHLHWEADDPHSGVKGYRYAVGTTRGGWDVTGGWVELATSARVMDLVREDLPIQDRATYYIAVQAPNGAGDSTD
ncbi:MAG: fibronectin type III domain-containing protein, partial [Firmicutes bacterium]|nr:fibronectin type III domain-containing protein [Bacillota bacterium]